MTQHAYICSYVNPDTDGVCSALAYAAVAQATGERLKYEPVMFGELQPETEWVLEYFSVARPQVASSVPSNAPIVLLDTHHPAQLPTDFPRERVTEIVDHHPAGESDAFPNAQITNEPVGAVATVLSERYRSSGATLDGKVAGLLGAAIISNTLNFTAPSTSERDWAASGWLTGFEALEPEFVTALFSARSTVLEKSTSEIVRSDFKEFNIGGRAVGIAQIELGDAAPLTGRANLLRSLVDLKEERVLDHILLNAASISEGRSVLIAPEQSTREILAVGVNAHFEGATAQMDRVLLRKTDLVPGLQSVLGAAA